MVVSSCDQARRTLALGGRGLRGPACASPDPRRVLELDRRHRRRSAFEQPEASRAGRPGGRAVGRGRHDRAGLGRTGVRPEPGARGPLSGGLRRAFPGSSRRWLEPCAGASRRPVGPRLVGLRRAASSSGGEERPNHDDHVRLIRDGVTGAGPRWQAGAGEGAFTLALADLLGRAGRITAIDRDARALGRMLEACRRAFPELQVDSIVGDFRTALPAGELDGLLAANSLHFVTDPAAVAARCGGALPTRWPRRRRRVRRGSRQPVGADPLLVRRFPEIAADAGLEALDRPRPEPLPRSDLCGRRRGPGRAC